MEKYLKAKQKAQFVANSSSFGVTASGNQVVLEEDENLKLGKRLREIRQEKGLTIREVSARSGISVNALRAYPNNSGKLGI